MTNITDYCDESAVSQISNLVGFSSFEILASLVEELVKSECDQVITNPHFDNENMKRDIRYRLGLIQGKREVIELVRECRRMV